jgi:hypothetical protein
VGILGRRRGLHPLGAQLRGEILVLHSWRWGVGEVLLLREAELGLLRRGLGAREGEGSARRVPFLRY